jgi:hypothetical protein
MGADFLNLLYSGQNAGKGGSCLARVDGGLAGRVLCNFCIRVTVLSGGGNLDPDGDIVLVKLGPVEFRHKVQSPRSGPSCPYWGGQAPSP